MSRNKKIILAALLLAVSMILSRFLSIKTPLVKISFAFVPTILSAIWLGPKWTVLIKVLEDLIGALLFPVGPYFIGYTISAGLSGLIYGLLLYQKSGEERSQKAFIIRLILSTTFVALFVNLGLNTLWISITAGKAFWILVTTRFVKELIMIPIEIAMILFIEKAFRKPMKQFLEEEND